LGGAVEKESTKISATLGYTLNLGNFESLRVDLGVTDYVHDNEDINQAQERVYKLVEVQLIDKVKEAREALEPK
jgi:methyl coenzyme M reductase subunit D